MWGGRDTGADRIYSTFLFTFTDIEMLEEEKNGSTEEKKIERETNSLLDCFISLKKHNKRTRSQMNILRFITFLSKIV